MVLCVPVQKELFTQWRLDPRALFNMMGRMEGTLVRIPPGGDWPESLQRLDGRVNVARLVFELPEHEQGAGVGYRNTKTETERRTTETRGMSARCKAGTWSAGAQHGSLGAAAGGDGGRDGYGNVGPSAEASDGTSHRALKRASRRTRGSRPTVL